jgi:hypothetical protein
MASCRRQIFNTQAAQRGTRDGWYGLYGHVGTDGTLTGGEKRLKKTDLIDHILSVAFGRLASLVLSLDGDGGVQYCDPQPEFVEPLGRLSLPLWTNTPAKRGSGMDRDRNQKNQFKSNSN